MAQEYIQETDAHVFDKKVQAAIKKGGRVTWMNTPPMRVQHHYDMESGRIGSITYQNLHQALVEYGNGNGNGRH